MKRYGNIITEETVTMDLCIQSIYDAAKFKENRSCVQEVLSNIDNKAKELRYMILTGDFKLMGYTFKRIIERGKIRDIAIPKFWPDQCIHHIMIGLIKNILMARIDPMALSSIPNRGPGKGFYIIKQWTQRNNFKNRVRYCFKGDIKKCFDSLTSEVVYQEFKKFIKDKQYLFNFKKIIFMHSTLPIGMYMSAWILNVVLKQMDYKIRNAAHQKNKSKPTYYLRYMDDFIILSSNKRYLKNHIVPLVMESLKKLNLKLKNNWKIFETFEKGIDMMGFRFFYNRVIMRKRNFKKFRRLSIRIQRIGIHNVEIGLIPKYLSMAGQLHKFCQGITKERYLNSINEIELVTRLRSKYYHLPPKRYKKRRIKFIPYDECRFNRVKIKDFPVPKSELQRKIINKLKCITLVIKMSSIKYLNILNSNNNKFNYIDRVILICKDILENNDIYSTRIINKAAEAMQLINQLLYIRKNKSEDTIKKLI